ncbi:DUF3040 domain-containing protein [Pseudonocardia bannensis]|uniref:DUF3040 domain-containing protein n=1 Tax=Pseudonocardia bannensis TaxID=630973 RepID=A0A848DS61_9PSEU|nr:DUF3040 domain-containing protein [Pseudonocardia bannensis]NMH95355.1 DUF3040 domain-containing protein [Pseudonocardia bannensis]
MSLSRREQQILARIENELDEKDPALAATFTQAPLPASFRRRFPLSRGHAGLLILALLTLVVLHSLALELGVVGLGILTAALIVPWMVSASRAGGGRDRTNAARARQTSPFLQGLLRWRRS